MKHTVITLWFSLPILLTIAACEREAPPKPIGAATNKHVEQAPTLPRKDAAEAMTEAMKNPLNKAPSE